MNSSKYPVSDDRDFDVREIDDVNYIIHNTRMEYEECGVYIHHHNDIFTGGVILSAYTTYSSILPYSETPTFRDDESCKHLMYLEYSGPYFLDLRDIKPFVTIEREIVDQYTSLQLHAELFKPDVYDEYKKLKAVFM